MARRIADKIRSHPRRPALVAGVLLVWWCLYLTQHIASIDDCEESGHGCDAPTRRRLGGFVETVSRGVEEEFDCRAHTPPCTEEEYGEFFTVSECKKARMLTTALDIKCIDGPERDIATSMRDLFAHLQDAEFHRPSYFSKALPEGAPLVSIIVPVHNAEAFLRRSVESILRQSYSNFELLLMDDSSSDESLAVCHELAFEDRRIRVLQIPWGRGVGSGPYVAKNYGILHARGRYVAFQDSDDVSHPTRIEAQVRFLEYYESVVYVTSNYVRMSPNLAILSNRGDVQRTSLQAAMFRRYMIKHIGFMDTVKVSADAEFYFRMIAFYGYQARGFVNLDHATLNVSMPLYYAFKRSGSLTQNTLHGYSLSSGDISGDRKTYERAFTAWHKTRPATRIDPITGRGFLYMDFPLRHRPFKAPAAHLVDSPFHDQSVVAMMATHRGRVHEFGDAVLSVAPYVDKMFIYLNDMTANEIPKNVRQLANVEIIQGFETAGNIQDNGKYYAIEKIDKSTYVFTVDDDIIYPKDYVQRMISKVEEYERKAVIGVHCITLTKEQTRFYDIPERRSVRSFHLPLAEDESAHVLGTGTTAWHSSALPDLSFADFPAEYPGMADVWMAKYAKEHGMDFRCISRANKWLQSVKEKTPSIWSRHQDEGQSDFKQVEILHQLYPEFFRSRFEDNESVSDSSMLDKLF